MSRVFLRLVMALVGVLHLAAAGGCGKAIEVGAVAGTVSYNGKPLNKPDGTILFVGAGGTEISAPIKEDGTYQASGVARGDNKVAVFYRNPSAPVARGSKRIPTPGARSESQNNQQFLTPTEYSHPDNSKLTVNVDQETVTYNPNLNGPPVK